jgi:cytosine/adenosine deaminase-related metal-dependent hydrolase
VLLKNLSIVNENQPVNISIYGEKIMAIGVDGQLLNHADPFQLNFADAIAIPGLINSHDHLDFNCFSVLGDRKYNHYTDWGKHIHESFKENINAVLKIPQNLRSAWGVYKNLLAGVTTVVNHGSMLKIENPLIDIFQEPQNIHSLGFEKNWKWKLNNPIYVNKDCVIHVGEGTDKRSSDEIDQLIKYNLFKRNLVAVHGVAMNPEQANNFKGLVWCPESNRVLLDHHAPIAKLKPNTVVLFGSDSSLTGSWNIWKHLRLARSLQQVTDVELLDTITNAPAQLWNMNKGKLQPKKDADIVIMKTKNDTFTMDELFKMNPEDILLIIHRGQIRLFDKSLLSQLRNLPINLFRYSQLSFNGNIKFVEGELPGLIAEIKKYNPAINFPVKVFETINQSHYD